jgi:SAM-dependent methyltransferase
MARAQHGDAKPGDSYIPFLDHFLRWWHGNDATDAGDDIALAEGGRDSGSDAGPGAITVDTEDDGLQWTDARVAFCQRLWASSEDDDEMVEPGGSAYCNTLLTPAAINSSKSIIDLSAGLGGGVRYLVAALGLWVTASDPDPELVKRAQQISAKRGLGKRAPISVYDPDALALPANKYYAVLLRERLYRMHDKQQVLATIRQSLKPAGSLILTDFALASEAAGESEEVAAWMAKQPEPPELWAIDAYRDAIERTGMQIQILDGASKDYRGMILDGWSRFIEGLKREELTREFVDTMMREAEYWLCREHALRSGSLVYLHCHATVSDDAVTR